MSAAERLGMFTSSGAHYPAKPECPHAAGRTNAGKNKSSQCARVIYLLRQTPLADPASCIFARGEASLWRTSALTRRVPSHVPSSPSLHGAPHSVRGCLIVARRGQQSLAIQSKANGKAGTGAVRNRLFRLEICTRSSQEISVRRDRIVHQPLKNAGKVHRENGNPKRGFKAAKKDLLPKNDSLKEHLSASAKIPVWRWRGASVFLFGPWEPRTARAHLARNAMPRIEQMKTVEGVRLGENLSLVAAVRDIFKGEYIKRSWESKSDGAQLQSDIASILGNLAIVATLFGAAGLTMFLMTQDLSFTGYYYRLTYGILTWTATLFSVMCVMLCFRVLVAVQLVDANEIHTFVNLLSDILVKPLKYNFIVIASLLFSLLVYGIDEFGWWTAIIIASASTVLFFFLVHFQTARTVQAVHEIALLRDAKGVA